MNSAEYNHNNPVDTENPSARAKGSQWDTQKIPAMAGIPAAPVEAFEQLLGRHPSHEEQLRLVMLKDKLNLPDDDAIWLIFVALQYHLSLYDSIPAKIMDSGKDFVARIEEASLTILRKNLHRYTIRLHELSAEAETASIQNFSREVERIIKGMATKQAEIAAATSDTKDESTWSHTCVGFAGGTLVLGSLLAAFVGALVYSPDILLSLRNILLGWIT